MEDFLDDFDDDDEGEYMDEDSFEDLEENLEMDEPFDDDSEFDNELVQTETEDDEFTAKDAFYTGTFAGWAYEEGLRERKRRSRK